MRLKGRTFLLQAKRTVLLKWFLTLHCTIKSKTFTCTCGEKMRSGPYSEELKQEIIRLNLKEKRSIKSLSLEYGISASTISRWLTVYRNREARENSGSASRL